MCRTSHFVLAFVLPVGGGSALAIEHDLPGGHPYELAGKRIVFTNWYFVRPGQPDWQDDQGTSLYANKDSYDRLALHYTYDDRPHGIRIVSRPAERRGPIVSSERPWEKMGIAPATLLQDEGKFRLWAGSHGGDGKRYDVYYESMDGLEWERPNLGIVEFDGGRDNNILELGIGAVFKDPSAPADERYKSAWHGSIRPEQFEKIKGSRTWSMVATEMDPGKVHAILGAVSPDGLHWRQLPDPLSLEPSDTLVVGYYDTRLRKYVLYTRSYMIGTRAPGYPPPSPSMYQLLARRAIGRTDSSAFRLFDPAETIVEPRPDMLPSDQIYTNCRTTIPGAPDHHMFFPTIFNLTTDSTHIEMYSSYDGRLLHPVPGGAVLRTAEYGKWDGGCIFATPNLTELPNGDWVLPYTGYTNPHKYPRGDEHMGVGLAVWPKGRMVALETADEGGFTTEAVIAPGTRLRINAVTQRTGSILVEAAGLDGQPIDGRTFADAVPVMGDQFWTPVRWRSADDLGIETGKPLVLRFRLKLATIYGIEFE